MSPKSPKENFNITVYHNTSQVVSATDFYNHFFTLQLQQEFEATESSQ